MISALKILAVAALWYFKYFIQNAAAIEKQQFINHSDTGVARNIDWEVPKLEKNLCRYFGDVMVMASLKWRHNYIFEFDFVIISFKSHYACRQGKTEKKRSLKNIKLRHTGLIYWCVLLAQLQKGFLFQYDIFGVKMSPASRCT